MPTTVRSVNALQRDLAVLLAEEDIEEIASLEPGTVRLRCWSGRTPGRALVAAIEADRHGAMKEREDGAVQRNTRSTRLRGRGHERLADRRDDRGDRLLRR